MPQSSSQTSVGGPVGMQVTKSTKGSRTSARLIDEGLRLFADRGFKGTTVGDIEQAAGLTPRSGALYKHFASKRDLLEAGLQRHIDRSETVRAEVVEFGEVRDLRAELTLVVRGLLGALDEFRAVTKILEKDGCEFPELRDKLVQGIAQPNYLRATEYVRDRLKRLNGPDWDAEALVAVMAGAAVNYRRMKWTWGAPPLELDENRFVKMWVEIAMSLLSSPGGDSVASVSI